MIAPKVNTNKEALRPILDYELKTTKLYVKMVPKNTTQKQNDNRKKIHSDMMERLTEEQDLLKDVITCDKR